MIYLPNAEHNSYCSHVYKGISMVYPIWGSRCFTKYVRHNSASRTIDSGWRYNSKTSIELDVVKNEENETDNDETIKYVGNFIYSKCNSINLWQKEHDIWDILE